MISEKSRVLTFGETMALLTNEQSGSLSHGPPLSLGIGGAESNVAIALSRLGTPVTWVGRVGTDSLGDLIVRELRAEGVTTGAIREESAPTGLMIKERRLPHLQRVWYYRRGSAGSRLEPADLPDELFTDTALVHLTGITPALSETAAAAVRASIDAARRAGARVSLDLNYRSALWPPEVAGPCLRELSAMADIVFAGADEAALALDTETTDPAELARRIASLGPTQVIIKLGVAGCLALVDGETYRQSAVPVQVVDTVGAGDAFVAGYLAELVSGKAVEARLALAVRAGAFACLAHGDWEGLPRRSELDLLDVAEAVLR